MNFDKLRKDRALLMLRCIRTYADFAIDKIDEANPIDEGLLDSICYCKEDLGAIVVCLFGCEQGNDR